jgi:hypothetical protein
MPLKEGIGGEREGEFTENFIIKEILRMGLGMKWIIKERVA